MLFWARRVHCLIQKDALFWAGRRSYRKQCVGTLIYYQTNYLCMSSTKLQIKLHRNNIYVYFSSLRFKSLSFKASYIFNEIFPNSTLVFQMSVFFSNESRFWWKLLNKDDKDMVSHQYVPLNVTSISYFGGKILNTDNSDIVSHLLCVLSCGS